MNLSALRSLGALLALALPATLLASSPSAAAEPTGSTQASNVVLYDGCRDWPVNYSVTLPAQSYDWSLDLSYVGPDGIETDSDSVNGSGSSGSGTAQNFVCPSFQDAGRYTVQASGEWCDNDYNCYPFTLPTSAFTVRVADTRTSLKVSDRTLNKNQRFTFFVKSSDERPNGFFPSDYADVRIQRKVGGKWVKAPSGDVFIDNGKGKVTYRWTGTRAGKVRAFRPADDNLGESVSKVLTLRSA